VEFVRGEIAGNYQNLAGHCQNTGHYIQDAGAGTADEIITTLNSHALNTNELFSSRTISLPQCLVNLMEFNKSFRRNGIKTFHAFLVKVTEQIQWWNTAAMQVLS
jgi:hypothetical protein